MQPQIISMRGKIHEIFCFEDIYDLIKEEEIDDVEEILFWKGYLLSR